MAGPYSAGTIFLQVVPSYADFQNTVRRDAPAIAEALNTAVDKELAKGNKQRSENLLDPDAAKASGKRAGQEMASAFEQAARSRLEAASKSLPPLRIGVEKNAVDQAVKDVQARLATLRNAEIGVDLDAATFRAELASVRMALEKMPKTVDISAKFNRDQAVASLRAFELEVAKSGNKAAEAFGGSFERTLRGKLKNAAQNLPAIEVKADTKPIDKSLASVRARLEKLSDVRIGIDMNAHDAIEEAAALESVLRGMSNRGLDIDTHVNTVTALAEVEQFRQFVENTFRKPVQVKLEPERSGSFESLMRARIKAAQDALPPIRITAAADPAEAKIREVQERLAALADKRINVDITGNEARAEMEVLRADLESLPDHVDIAVQADMKRALAELAAFQLEAEKIDHTRASVHVEVNGAAEAAAELAVVKKEADGVGGGIGNSANAFRAFNGYLLLFSTIGPAVIPVLGALAGGLLAIGPAAIGAGTGLGILIAGFSGLGPALTALNNFNKNSAKDALANEKAQRTAAKGVADAQRGAARSIEDARRSVSDAERQAADGISSALRTQEDAERSLADAQRGAIKAQQDLVDARKQAAQDIQDLNSRVKGGKLDERQGVIDVFNATVANQNTQADPGATNLEKEQASIALERAKLALADTRRENQRLAAEKKTTDKEGVNGTARVQSAQDALTSALQRQQDAVRSLGDADKAVNRARVDGARSVARAQEQLQRAQEDAASSIASAMAAQREAMKKTNEVGSASSIALKDAMDKLGPAGQKFVYFLAGLQTSLYAWRDDIQKNMLPPLEDALNSVISVYGKDFGDFLAKMGGTLGSIFGQVAAMLEGPAFQAFFSMMDKMAPIFTQQVADIAINLSEAFANIMVALAPFSQDFGDALVTLSEKFKTWTKNLADNKDFQSFLNYARREGPKVLDLVGALLGAAINLGKALAPYADKILALLTGILNWVAGLNPKVLSIFVVGLIAMIASVQIVAGLVSAVVSGLSILTIVMDAAAAGVLALAGEIIVAILPFILIAAAVAGVVIGLIILYKKSETFRNIVNAAFKSVGDAGKWLWEHALKPAFNGIVGAFQALGRFFAEVWNGHIFPIIDLWGAIIKTLWKDVIKPTFRWIGEKFSDVGKAFKWTWEHILKPIFDVFMDVIGNQLVGSFTTGLDLIGKAWDGLKDLAKKPVKFIVDTVINRGVIGTFNKVADFFHTKKMSEIQLPKGFDRGGWTGAGEKYKPAGIVHADEYVIRKESTNKLRRMFGLGWLDHLNEHGTPPGFARGGLVGPISSGPQSHPFGGRDALIAFGRMLQQMGFRVSENPLFGGVNPVHTKNSLHYTGDAIDVNWAPGESDAEKREIDKLIPLARAYGLRTIWRVKDHFDHAHFDDATSGDMLGGGDGSGGGIFGFLKGLNPIDWFRDKVDALPRKVFEKFGQNPFTEMLIEVPKTIVEFAKDKIVQLAGSIGDAVHGYMNDPSMAGGAVNLLVQQQAEAYGWGRGAQWEALSKIISEESGWNPTAQNPSSTAFGLFQFLDGTWSSVGGSKTSDPTKQAMYGLKYIHDRYGDPEKALAFHDANGYYSEGGLVGANGHAQTTLYDAGGILPPGITAVANASGKPEAVFTNEQLQNLERIANQRGTGGGLHIDARSYGSDLEPDDVVGAMLFGVRTMALGGKYADLGVGIGAGQ